MPFLEDLRYAVRALRRSPAFTVVAVLTLALGIGPNVAIFSAVHAMLLRSLPFPNAVRLVRIESLRGGEAGSISYRESRDLAALPGIFEGVAVYTDQGQYNASGDGPPEELVSTITTQNLFRVLGVPLLLGEPWPEQLDRSRDFKLVISYDLWQRRFGGDRSAVGRTLTLDGAPGYTILGVLPRGFAFPIRSDLYRSHGIAAAAASYEDRAIRGRWGIARLRPGVTLSRAHAAMAALATRLSVESPTTNSGITYRATPLRDLYVGEARPYLLLVLGAVALVLLIACSNVANLMLARLYGREREIAVRLAIGASRSSVTRLLLLEGIVVAALALVPAVLFAAGGLRALTTLIRADLPIWMSIDLSIGALAFAFAIAVLSGIGTSLLPASRVARGDLALPLRSGARGSSSGPAQPRLRSALVIGELALAVLLLFGAGLMVRGFQALTRLSPGFRTDSLLTFRVELGWRAYPGNTAATFFRDLLARASAIPGVTSAAVISNLPLDGRPKSDNVITLQGQTLSEQRSNPYVNLRRASTGLLRTLRMSLERGRFFEPTDRDSMPLVAVVAHATAARLWPGRDALGARFVIGTDSTTGRWWTVIGVVGDVRHETLDSRPAFDVYLPVEQSASGSQYVLLETRGDPSAVARRATALVGEIDPNQSFFDVRTMRDRVGDRVWIPRLAGVLFSGFGALAAVLGAIGVFAVLAYAVSQRTRELGVRQALGASPQDLVRLVVRDGMRMALIGGATGLVAALSLAWILRHLVRGVSIVDGPTLVGVPVVLVLIAGFACWIPSRRVLRISPSEALRADV